MQLASMGIDLIDAAFKLANTLPNIISVPLNMNESRTWLVSAVASIAEAVDKATPLPQLPDRAAWLAARGEAPLHVVGAELHAGAKLARIPDEVPELPPSWPPSLRPSLPQSFSLPFSRRNARAKRKEAFHAASSLRSDARTCSWPGGRRLPSTT